MSVVTDSKKPRKGVNAKTLTIPGPLIIISAVAGAVLALVTAASTAAFAEPNGKTGGSMMIGPAIAPEFEGSDHYEVLPGFVGTLEHEGRSLTVTPFALDMDLVPSKRFTLGPSLTHRFSRDDVEDSRVDRLDKVDQSLELGANGAINFDTFLAEGDLLSFGLRITQDVVDGHGGLVGTTSMKYSYPVTSNLRVTGGVDLTAVTDDYADAYFGISGAEAARSGLTAYEADGGLKDAKFSIMADYSLSESWSLSTYVSYSRLLGDFKDSSIVQESGTPNQMFGFAGLRYFF